MVIDKVGRIDGNKIYIIFNFINKNYLNYDQNQSCKADSCSISGDLKLKILKYRYRITYIE